MYSFLQLWTDYFAPFFKIHKLMYAMYIAIILIFYFIQTILFPKIISMYTHYPSKKWFSADYLRRFYPLLGVFLVMIIMIFFKNRMDAVLPTMHFKWLREKMFEDMVWSYREKKDSIPIGVFMMRYNLLPQEIRVIFEDTLETFPAALSLLYLFIYFCTFDVCIGLAYLLLYASIFLYLVYSKSGAGCRIAVEERAMENIRANDTASQEVLNLNHIYANQVEEAHILAQSGAEDALQKKWECAQKTINRFLVEINMMGWAAFGVMLALFFQYFRKNADKRRHWPAVFLVLTFTQSTLMGAMPRWLGLLNGFTMIRIYQESILSLSNESVKVSPGVFTETDDYMIEVKDMSLVLGSKTIFSGFSMRVPHGQRIVVHGASGSGKSSLFNILARYITSYTGTVAIGGVDLREWDVTALRKRVVFIPQQTHLFDKSILYNICVGECSAEQRARVESVIRKYGWERIFGGDLDKGCGVMGKDLSHGMQKLIILLRLMWRIEDARIILIDEPLASLDGRTQEEILDFLADLTRGRTLFVNNHVPLTQRQKEMFDQLLDSSSFIARN